MHWSTMEVSHYRQLEIGHVALYVHKLHVILLVDGRLHRFHYTNIWSRAASCSCCFQFDGQFLTMRPGSCFWWLHLQHCAELSGVWVVVGSQRAAYWKKHPSFCSILFHAQLAEVSVSNRFPHTTRHFNITTLPPIKYLSSDRIMIWWVHRLCSSRRSFTSRSQICDPTNIGWVGIENPLISLQFAVFSQPLNEYQSDCKSECARSKRRQNCTIYVLILSRYDENSNT